MEYTIQTTVDGAFDDVTDATIAALEAEGFGVLCDIDVQAVFAEKLDAEFDQYRILGACNPDLAYDGLDAEIELGTLLPCNVVVYETETGEIGVSLMDPRIVLGLADDDRIDAVAREATDRLERVVKTIAADHASAA
ncbi:DUF302 domain-containing protein [Halococcoides cellulosivorans]|uniref:DUF302 domain-containing protein n=1 Tax=Halococcoides cellulosivorans TaxID=1679096 RepID=A0A2R4X2K5_9EURY|nr:DUF302 domain-containing protein [Halococcoides cellulosivorans]AWB28049.1 hypothetical protein HARCEL1_10185 [Halococcoides cellulosivorans]